MSSSEKQGCRQQLVSEGWEDKGRRAPGLAPQTTALMDVTGCCVNKPIQDLQGCGPGGRDPSRPCSGLGPHSPLQKPQVWGGTGGCGNRSITSQSSHTGNSFALWPLEHSLIYTLVSTFIYTMNTCRGVRLVLGHEIQ